MDSNSRQRIASSTLSRAEESTADTWSGHLPVTQQRLLPILQRAAAGAHDFSLLERSLFVICEFWAAAVARDLGTHWRSKADESLHALIALCVAIGLSDVAAALTEARRDLDGPLTPEQRRQRIGALEEQLLKLNAPIDQIIGRFAQAIPLLSSARVSWNTSSALSGDAI